MNRNKIVKDTIFMTAVDFAMQGLALMLNVFITRKLGSAAVGAISLMGTFFCFTAIISSGNVYLCSSRLTDGTPPYRSVQTEILSFHFLKTDVFYTIL